MKHLIAVKMGLAMLASFAAQPSVRAETYMANPKPPCIMSPAGFCWTPLPSPPGWKCHWSMDLKGTEIKSLIVNGITPPDVNDASTCDLKACTTACAKTEGCIAVDIMKPSKIEGQWNNAGACVCTLFSSVTSATKFEEIRAPVEKLLSGWACLRLPKSPPPPITENPNLPGIDRPGLERDQTRPGTPGTTGTPGRRSP